MAKILLIETATAFCSVAISVDGKIISLKEESGQNLHASNLTLFIEEVIKKSGMSYGDLDAVAISKGPGSYTGLRIGVSTAKGLCYALEKPLIAIETLEMMAAGFLSQNPGYDGLICPMIDARRMEVYTSVYNAELTLLEPTSAKIIDENSFSDLLSENIITFLGDGSAKCAETLKHVNALFSDVNFNSAANLSLLAENAFNNTIFEDVAYFEPFYLKDFVLTQPKKRV
ncbi:tRNA (adenosine(37)-N6)-threonylcarbamoyltransferase complex dimerization subunit type 1 TsaB [Pedobacter rhodius]|uniref:tRNA (Adenosine(37)-N6)-threonylcarbamoyltransferase complex dimerization subunit type 1 TsaB n=1 Tax=Pedobacter rhodius TaxID=3004098 RepID=A0ABT4KTP3_9SPHI|nr:tRNA (adenosine(37)-N6)-threonylcarbamoyltransferase complex dimerization subunit type 1 TsaB [Pedobacter sp. SJ11]MCZ4222288.1 tRNA (adenosine(37)-N6)-threonylcarbamoyltransferase complex dimerization subunit type 1 TsaB [Pedobacter sp. SJ11]